MGLNETQTTNTSNSSIYGSAPSPIAGQATWPLGSESPPELFRRADAAFHAGNLVEAQRLFGLLFIIDPSYQNGVALEALVETCRLLPANCDFLIPRLEFMRDGFYGAFGPPNTWPPQQAGDFQAIIDGFEFGLLGDFPTAVDACGPVTQSPLPQFAQAALLCADQASGTMNQIQTGMAAETAMADWNTNRPCIDEYRPALTAAYDEGDWETFVSTYPRYNQCAMVLRDIIDDGILENHPAMDTWDYNVTWSNLDEMSAIMEDNRSTYEEVRDGLAALDDRADYGRLVIDWESAESNEQRILGEIANLEAARDGLGEGSGRDAIQTEIDMQRSVLRDVRDEMRDVMGDINSIRRSVGLDDRDTP